MKGNKHVRDLRDLKGTRWQLTNDFYCDYCRIQTDNPEAHNHEERPLD